MPEHNATSPTPTPSYKVKVGSFEEMTQQSSGLLRSFTVETHIDKIGIARIVLAAGKDLDPSKAEIGGDVEIVVQGDARKAFKGYITGRTLQWAPGNETMVITAMDPLVKLAASNVTKVWGGKPSDKFKDSDLASEVISAGGASAGTVDNTAGERPYIFQRAESNLAFLKRLASRNGYLVYADEGKVHFKKPQFSDAPIEVNQPDIAQLDFTQSDTAVPEKVKVIGWDYVQKKQVTGEQGASSATALGGGSVVGNLTYSTEFHIVDVFVNSDAAAKEMATGELERMARSYIQGTCTMPANGQFYPGVKVKFSQLPAGMNPAGVVVGVRHVLESGTSMQTTIWFVGNTDPE